MTVIPFRIKYFLSHFIISLIIAGLSLFLIFYIWYPNPLHKALGVGQLVWLMLGIDVILGPILTLIIAKQGKKSLKVDLAFIGLIQIIALLYGLYSIDKGRPVAIAFDVNRFELVQKHMIQGNDNQKILNEYQQIQSTHIPVVSVRPAKDDKELEQRIKEELEMNRSSSANPQLYEPLEKNMNIVLQEMKPISDLFKFNDKKNVDEILVDYPQADGFLLLVASEKNITVLIDSKNNVFVAVVDLRPW